MIKIARFILWIYIRAKCNRTSLGESFRMFYVTHDFYTIRRIILTICLQISITRWISNITLNLLFKIDATPGPTSFIKLFFKYWNVFLIFSWCSFPRSKGKCGLIHIVNLLLADRPRSLSFLVVFLRPIPSFAVVRELFEQKRPGKYLAVPVNEIE